MIDWDALVAAPCAAVFGESSKPSYKRAAGGAPFAIDGIFDDAYHALIVQADGDPEIAGVNPVIGVRISAFGGTPPVQDDKIYVPRVDKTFIVIDVQSDGLAIVKLVLAETTAWT